VEGTEKRHGPAAAGMPPGQLQSCFDRLSAAIGEKHTLGRRAGRDLGEFLGQVDLRAIVEVGPRHVQQFGRLVLDSGDDLRVAMPGGGDGDAGGEVEEAVAIDVFDDGSTAALDDQRVDARV
jgi:hypothetical protein